MSKNEEGNEGRGQRIVGVLTWNMFGKMDLARQVRPDGRVGERKGGRKGRRKRGKGT